MDLLDYILAHPLFPARRLPSLYADFRRLKDSNPDGYEANIIAWQKVLTQAVREGGPRYWKGAVKSVDDEAVSKVGGADGIDDVLIIHSGRKLQDSLTSREWGKPLGLSAVIVSGSIDKAHAKQYRQANKAHLRRNKSQSERLFPSTRL
jgi:charged multivesicular body protein 7